MQSNEYMSNLILSNSTKLYPKHYSPGIIWNLNTLIQDQNQGVECNYVHLLLLELLILSKAKFNIRYFYSSTIHMGDFH